ncbi:hypothetical protein D3C80_1820300 [compost metagenome]
MSLPGDIPLEADGATSMKLIGVLPETSLQEVIQLKFLYCLKTESFGNIHRYLKEPLGSNLPVRDKHCAKYGENLLEQDKFAILLSKG